VRQAAEIDQLRQEVLLQKEETRIKDARIALIDPRHRPHYPPPERLSILELRAARGWSLEQAARVFLVTGPTIASWTRRLDEEGPDALVQIPSPVNKFPEMVTSVVQRLKVLCSSMGKTQIAQTLTRAGLHLGVSTVGRRLKAKPGPAPPPVPEPAPSPDETPAGRVVTAKRPDHVWHVDLTAVPTASGFWVPWLPYALPQRWPFCWWVALVIDHFSRRVMGYAVFDKQPTSLAIRTFLGRLMSNSGSKPQYIICDQGEQFSCGKSEAWCRAKGIQPRFGAVGQHGSIAIIERTIRTIKGIACGLCMIPTRREKFRRELQYILEWYNEHRPHRALGGRTPNEVYEHRFPAHRRPRFEPRPRWPRGSSCARPWALVKGKVGVDLELEVTYYAGRRHLPIVQLRSAA
jgi:putative transposase